MNQKTFTRFFYTTLLLSCFSILATGQAFFTETFKDSLPSSWTVRKIIGNDAASARWNHTKAGPAGSFAISPLASTSKDNGWMIFDSDLNCNEATGQDVWLISPVINASDKSSVFLVFETFYRKFNDRPQIRVGTNLDSISSWATIEVFPGVNNNEYGGKLENNEQLNPQVRRINITEYAAGKSAVYFAFQYLSTSATLQAGTSFGCAYAWQIDDVQLTSESLPDNELVAADPLLPDNYATPVSQIDSVFFALSILNNGKLPQTNVKVKVDVEGDNGDMFTATEDVGDIDPSDTLDLIFEETFVPSGTGIYIYDYTITQTEADNVISNNTRSGAFIVTEGLYSKDDDRIASATQPSSVSGETWEIGNYYVVVKEGFEAYEASFSVASNADAHQGKSVTVILYKVTGNILDGLEDDELETVGFGSYDFTNEENFDLVTAELFPLEGELEPGVELTPGEYLLMVQYTPDLFVPYSELAYNLNYQIATVVKNGDWFLGGFGSGVTAQVRMRIRSTTTATKDPQLADNQIDVYPNPAQNTLNVKIDLQEVSTTAQVSVLDATGRTMLVRSYEGVKSQTIPMDVSRWASGTYFLHVRTDEGVKTERILVQH
ncbi:MAG: T9SS type A sorting domain-containing protein [Saprospiraceae bacterium]|nr:T9SS type A sorting domain-containing protein [Saprospiraceae bacterium]